MGNLRKRTSVKCNVLKAKSVFSASKTPRVVPKLVHEDMKEEIKNLDSYNNSRDMFPNKQHQAANQLMRLIKNFESKSNSTEKEPIVIIKKPNVSPKPQLEAANVAEDQNDSCQSVRNRIQLFSKASKNDKCENIAVSKKPPTLPLKGNKASSQRLQQKSPGLCIVNKNHGICHEEVDTTTQETG